MSKIRFIAIALLFVSFAGNSFAGNDKPGKADHAERNKKMMEREAKKAEHMRKQFQNMERLEKKYGKLKESNKAKYDALSAAMQAASAAWDAVIKKASSAQSPEELTELKVAAYNASSAVYIADLEMKFAGNAFHRKEMAEKIKDKTIEDAVKQLDETEQQLIEAQKSKLEAEKKVRELEIKTRAMSKNLREAFNTAKKGKKKE